MLLSTGLFHSWLLTHDLRAMMRCLLWLCSCAHDRSELKTNSTVFYVSMVLSRPLLGKGEPEVVDQVSFVSACDP